MPQFYVLALCALCLLSGLAWVPILIKFYRNWSFRKNPVSFAIVTVIGLCIYCSLTGIWFFTGQASATWLITAIVIAQLVVCGGFHLAFWRSDKKFPNARH